MDSLEAPHLVITGPMGSGKTTVGRILAGRLGRPLLDSDEQIETEMATNAREISQSRGVSALHRIEAEALQSALDQSQPAVIAAAASVADIDDLGAALGGREFVVFLTGDPTVLGQRAAAGDHRRRIDLVTERRMALTRSRRLRAVADVEVDVTDDPPEVIADIVMAAFARGPQRR